MLPNLVQHHPGYPAAGDLLATVKAGNPHRGVRYLGEGHDTEGSRWIIDVVDRPDPRPVNLAIWGGSTELAQALWRVRHDRSAADSLASWASSAFTRSHNRTTRVPGSWRTSLSYFTSSSMRPEGRDKRESAYRGMYLGGDMELTSRAWIDDHVREAHGPLGALYPPKTWTAPNPHSALKEGDTPSWLYFSPNGLNVPGHPEWGGWGGRFHHISGGLYRDAEDTVGGTTHARATVWRWRPAFQNDFQARMDWCVLPFEQANHAPSAGFRGDDSRDLVELKPASGTTVDLDASGSSDPDRDELSYRWFVYPEAGTYERNPTITNAGSSLARLHVPGDAGGESIHVILEVTDDGTPPLTAYRRIVLSVENGEPQ